MIFKNMFKGDMNDGMNMGIIQRIKYRFAFLAAFDEFG